MIALVKDVPDVAGDRRYGIRSFSVRLGRTAVLRAAARLLALNLAAAAITLTAAATTGTAVVAARRGAAALAAAGGARLVLHRHARVDARSASAVTEYYMLLWKVFYAAYFVLPFAR